MSADCPRFISCAANRCCTRVVPGAADLSATIDIGLAMGAMRTLPAAIRGAAWLALGANNPGKAARLLGIADHWAQAIDIDITQEARLLMEVKTGVIERLQADMFEVFWREGFDLPLERGPAEALQITRAFAQTAVRQAPQGRRMSSAG